MICMFEQVKLIMQLLVALDQHNILDVLFLPQVKNDHL